ncbi:hypothetical protein AB2C54_34030, partial [Pseudomonas aeruginosa]
VFDCDGDASEWTIRKGKRGAVIAAGSRHDGNHFFECLRNAEAALRRIVAARIAELREAKAAPLTPPSQPGL